MGRDAAAALLGLHPTAAAHRLRRFVQLTGADLADIVTTVDMWWTFCHAAGGPPH